MMRKKHFVSLIFLFLFSFFFQFLLAQQYDFRNLNVEDGLVQSQVIGITQDRAGNMWFGTNGGVSKFDGKKFTNFTESDTGLVNNTVYAITELKNGNLVFSTNRGISIYNGKKFKNIKKENGLPHYRVFSTLQDKSGTIWLGTGAGVCQLEGDSLISFKNDSLLNNSAVRNIYQDLENNIWFATLGSGAIKYSPSTKKFKHYSTQNGLSNNIVYSIVGDSLGNIYFGTIAGIRIMKKDGKIEKINIPNEENIGFASIAIDYKNVAWFGTTFGIDKFDGYNYSIYNEKNGLINNYIFSLYIDREGNIWFATYNGISKFLGESFRNYTTKDGLPKDYIASIFQDSKKNIWMGIKGTGAIKIQKNEIKIFTNSNGNSITDNDVRSISEDNNGNIYFGTIQGLSVYDGISFKNYLEKNGLSQNSVYSIIRGNDDYMWIGTENGLNKMKNGKIERIESVNKIIKADSLGTIFCVFEDSHQNFWLATEKGVLKFDGKKIVWYNKSKGFTDKRVLSIVEDRYNNLWFATHDGLFNYDYKKFDLVSGGKIYLLLQDDFYLWLGTDKGVDKVNLVAYYSQHKFELKHFGKEEGFFGVECNFNAACKDDEGVLWFGTIKGATAFNPKYERINTKEAITQISNIRLFYKTEEATLKKYSEGFDSNTKLPIHLSLPYDINHLTFDFIGICHSNPGRVKYQFKLEGADLDWFPPTQENFTTYSSLNAGDYTFYLKSMNNDGLWNKNPVVFKFTILPPWWKTWWFYSLALLAVVSGIYLFIVVRTRNLEQQKQVLENEVELRTHELREEKEKVELVNIEVIEQKAIIENKNNDILDSIKYAKNIQEALLPPIHNVLHEMKDAFVLYMPKDIVSGDFYWFIKHRNKRYIATVDCTGHGVPGAFMSIIGNTLLNEIVSNKNISVPAEVLNELHIGVKNTLKQANSETERRDGMDLALCCLNEDSSVLEFAGANRSLWIFRKNKPKEESFELIKSNKFPIGGLEMENESRRIFTNHTIELEKGDVVYIFTDGYADQFGGPKGKKFMVGNLQKLASEIYHKPINEQKQLFADAFYKWKGEQEQVDDILIIGFRI